MLELDPHRRAVAADLGLATVDPATVDVAPHVREQTGGAGADVVFEVSGSAAGVRTATDVLAVRGRLVVVAIHPQPARGGPAPGLLAGAGGDRCAGLPARRTSTRRSGWSHDGQVPADRLISRIVPLERRGARRSQALEAGGEVKVLVDCQAGEPR